MRKIRIYIFVCLFIVVWLLIGSGVQAEPTVQEIQDKIDETLKDKLNLSEEQLNQIKNEQAQQVAERKLLAIQEEAKRIALKEELEKNQSDPQTIDTLVQELNAIREDVINLRVQSVQTLKQILSEEQYQKVVEIQNVEAEEKIEKKKIVEEKWGKWKESNNFKKQEQQKWYYYYW